MSILRSKLIRISSKDRQTGGTFTNFRVDLGSEEKELHQVKKTSLVSCIFSNNAYNINANNNTFVYDLAGEQTMTIPIGQYTAVTLMAEIVSQEGSFTITQSTLTYKLTFANAGAFILYDVDTKAASTLSPYLGITTTTASGTSVEVDNVPDLNGLDSIFIKSNVLGKGNMIDSNENEYNVIASIPVEAVFGDNNVYHETHRVEGAAVVYPSPKGIHSVDIHITDHNHETVYLQSDITLVFKVYF